MAYKTKAPQEATVQSLGGEEAERSEVVLHADGGVLVGIRGGDRRNRRDIEVLSLGSGIIRVPRSKARNTGRRTRENASMASAAARGALLSPQMRWAVGGWTFFIAENTILSENRTYIIDRIGEQAYHLCYGALSTVAMGTVAYGYARKVRFAGPLLWSLGSPAPPIARVVSFATLSLGTFLISQVPPKLQIPVELTQGGGRVESTNEVPEATTTDKEGFSLQVRCPFDFTDNKDPSGPVHGIERVTRHPGLWSFGLMGMGVALLTPSLPQRAWLAMPAFVALIGGAHTDSRFRRGLGGELPPERDNVTSNIPFRAIVNGSQGNVLDVARDMSDEVKPLNAAIAIGLSGLFVLRRGRGMKIPVR